MINSIQSLRGIFILMIFLHHYKVNGNSLFEAGGVCGVDFFLILSGFVMCEGYSKKIVENFVSVKAFLTKRIVRVYPLHILCLVTWIVWRLICKSEIDWISLVPNAFLIQSWIPFEKIYFSGNAVCWCLSDLLFFYSVFPLLARILNKFFKPVLFGLIICIILYFILIHRIPSSFQHALIYINPMFRVFDFLIGMILWKFWVQYRKGRILTSLENLGVYAKTCIEILPISIYTIFIYIHPMIPEIYGLVSYWWMPTIITVLIFALFKSNGGYVTRLLNLPFLVKFGNMSFTFYMLHTLGISIITAITHKLGFELNWIVNLIMIFAIITTISIFVSEYYEKPIGEYASKYLGLNKRT